MNESHTDEECLKDLRARVERATGPNGKLWADEADTFTYPAADKLQPLGLGGFGIVSAYKPQDGTPQQRREAQVSYVSIYLDGR